MPVNKELKVPKMYHWAQCTHKEESSGLHNAGEKAKNDWMKMLHKGLFSLHHRAVCTNSAVLMLQIFAGTIDRLMLLHSDRAKRLVFSQSVVLYICEYSSQDCLDKPGLDKTSVVKQS